MPQKTDKAQLLGILDEFEFNDVTAVVDDLRDDLMAKPKSENLDNPGGPCVDGEDGFIACQESREAFEAVWQQYNLLPVHFLTEGAQVQKTVAMVTLKQGHNGLPAGNGWGSGFLVSDSLFMTNNHVIEDEAFCDKVNMQFMYQDNYNAQPAINSEFFETNENSFFHTNAALDYTIVRLARKYPFTFNPSVFNLRENGHNGSSDSSDEYADADQAAELRKLGDVIARKEPITAIDPARLMLFWGYTAGSKYGFVRLRPNISYPQGMRLNVIQHPRGRKKEVVVQQNELKDVHTNFIHYFSDTDYGSSGSPVFDNQWNLMALHHARKNAESANEGVRIDKIVADLRNQFQNTNPEILAELGI